MNRVAVLSCFTLAILLVSGCAIEPATPPDVPGAAESAVQPAVQPVQSATPESVSQVPPPVPVPPRLVRCEASLGPVAVEIPAHASWLESLQARHLPSPDSAIRAMIRQSACFELIPPDADKKTVPGHYTLRPEVSFGQTGLRRILSRGKVQEHHDATALLALTPPSGKGFAAASGRTPDITPDGDWKALFPDKDDALTAYVDAEQGQAVLSALLDAYNQLVLTVRHATAKTSDK